jgi:predicted RND superfamily exporter protein
MQNYTNFLDKYKLHIIILTTLLVALLSISLKNIAFEGSYRVWFAKDSKIIKDYDNFRDTFSGDDTFVIAFEDKSKNGIFSKKAIDTIINITDEFEQIDGVREVNSLTNYQYISSDDKNGDDMTVENFIEGDEDLEDLDVLEQKKQIATNDNLILNQLINKDATSTMIAVKLSSETGANEEVNIFVMEQLEQILKNYEQNTNYKFYLSGSPAITASLVTIAINDAIKLMPLAVIVVVVLLFVLFRNIIGVIVPSVVIVFTFLIVLSIQMLLGYKLNNFTVNIPSFISAIAIADSMHLFLAWVYYKGISKTNKEAVYQALKNNILPIAMTSITTAIGFATLGLSDIEPIGTLGIAITSGAIIAFVLSITIAPAILLILSDDYKVPKIKLFNFIDTKGYGSFIVKNDKKILSIFLLLFIIIGYGLTYINVDSNSIKYFGKDTTVRSGANFIEDKLTGSMIYEIIVDSKQKDGAKDPAYLAKIVQFEKKLKTKFSNVTFTTSLKDIIIRMQKVLNPNSKDILPNDKNLVAQYLLLYSMSLPQGMEINDKIDTYQQKLRLTINSNIQDTSKDLIMIDWIESWWKINSTYEAKVQGQTAIFAYMQDSVTSTLVISITSTLLLVSFAMYFIFRRNIKLGQIWIFILPNVAPIILVAGLMGYVGINIDIGVAISASVILGIAVDDTIHFFSKYFSAIKTKSFEDSIDYVISHSGTAMILTTFILSCTFAVFGASSFIPNINFALVTVSALSIALLLDLVLLPVLLSLFTKHKVV